MRSHLKRMAEKCAEYARLQTEVAVVLKALTAVTAQQLEAFQRHDQARFMQLDKELENTVGLKERTIGALRQHLREHKCQTP
jgi:hypothetical protein